MSNLTVGLVEEIGKLNSIEECKQAWSLIKSRHSQLISKESIKFFVGQEVSFMARNQTWIGVIEKVNNKSVSVATKSPVNMKWKVSPSLLTIHD